MKRPIKQKMSIWLRINDGYLPEGDQEERKNIRWKDCSEYVQEWRVGNWKNLLLSMSMVALSCRATIWSDFYSRVTRPKIILQWLVVLKIQLSL